MENKFFAVGTRIWKCFAAVLMLLLLLLTACTAEPQEETGEYITFTDDLGREVTVEKNPGRTAALLGSFADIWVLSGGELCASAADAWEDFDLPLEEAANIGGAHSPSLEQLIAADPSFVLGSTSTPSHVEMLESLESMGIAAAFFDVDTFTDYLRMLDICTDITGRKDLYRQYGLQLQTQIAEIKEKYANAGIPEKERTVLLLRASSGTVKAKGSAGTVLGEMLADMGCIHIADNDKNLLENLSVESVIKEEPHHIFVVTMGKNTEAAVASVANMIKENPAWGTLEAVRENRLHIMDKRLFNLKPNAQWAQAYRILYEILIDGKE